MSAVEVNFDGLVGPTHNFAGLAHGNLASARHRGAVSRPRAAALQGLAKMKALADRGVPQAILPPHARPAVEVLRAFGFNGPDAQVLTSAAREAPQLLAACSSAAAMWVANAATVTPSADSADGRVHFTPANLGAKLHRAIEAPQTLRTLRAIFRAPERFVVHAPVPVGQGLGDEGAANHTRFAPAAGALGLHLLVYGHDALAAGRRGAAGAGPERYPSRQAREASEAIVRQHGLDPRWVVLARQAPRAIDAGVFHNDVIAVGHEQVLLHHEQAWVNTRGVINELRRRYAALHRGMELHVESVAAKAVPLADAVRSYLFNSQLVTRADGALVLVAPAECRRVRSVAAWLDELIASGRSPIREVLTCDLRESMRNGGGPACLRLRVVLTETELAALPASVRLNDENHAALTTWVERHYREELRPEDLADPQLLEESRRALDELTLLLGLGSIYPFQK